MNAAEKEEERLIKARSDMVCISLMRGFGWRFRAMGRFLGMSKQRAAEIWRIGLLLSGERHGAVSGSAVERWREVYGYP